MMITHRFSVGVVVAIALAGCGGQDQKSTAPTPGPNGGEEAAKPVGSLFERLGGKPAVTAVVEEFVARLAADPRVKFRFANSNIPSLTSDLIDFVCMATGGPCQYTGRDMKTLHASMNTTEAEWDATVEALVGALDKYKVGAAEKNELLAALGPVKEQIVDPPANPPSGDELARIDAAGGDLSRFGDNAEILGAAFTALRAGQRSYAEQLFSMAEVTAGAKALAKIAPLFRQGGPPRITTPLVQLPADSPPQPKGAVGDSDEDAPPKKPEKGSLSGTMRLDGKSSSAFGVVMLTPAKGGGRKRTPKQRVVEQRGREFAPRVMAVPVGSTVQFPNFDGIYHNVFSRSEARPFDLGIFKNGQAREVKFDREGIVRVGCNLHANMSTSIIVVSAPHYAVTDGSGKFKFRSLKPGKYKLRAWTERSAEPVTRTVEIKPGANSIDVDAAGGAASGPQPDKFGAPRGKSS